MRVKLLITDLVPPKKAHLSDAGFDVHSPLDFVLQPNEGRQVKLGFALEIAQDEVCVMSERSGMAINYGITSIGNIVDSGYRGEVSIIIRNLGDKVYEVKKGDRIGQMLILKLGSMSYDLVDELTESDRGTAAHYSSGK